MFVCALCNDGLEFVHRLDVRWVDVIHLALFNLTLQDSKTYFPLNDTIIPWINDNWEFLQAQCNKREANNSLFQPFQT